jgi:hypothetical protein
MDSQRLAERPEAKPFTVEELLGLVKRGRIRLPDFQRPLRWRTPHVQKLFDSLYRGLPIGALLLSVRSAPAEAIGFGVFRQDVQAVPEAYFVVDGQQRVAACAAALLHPSPVPRGDVHAIWFDLENRVFVRLSRREPGPAWIPLNVLGDSMKQMEWLLAWPHRGDRKDLVETALALGKAIREYQIPAYVLRNASEDVLREVYRRINNTGVAMRESEVFTALFHGGEQRPLDAACRRLSELGFGPVSDDLFLTCLKSVEGVDSRRGARSSDDGGDELLGVAKPESVARTEEAVRRTITFLMEDAGIPHNQLLPYELSLSLLSRFFDAHPEPSPRSRLLLARWVWRGALSGEHSNNSHATLRGLRSRIDEDEAASVGRLLESVPRAPDSSFPRALTRWYGQSAKTRLCALAMLALRPRDPKTGAPVDTADLQARLENKPLRQVFPDVARGKNTTIARRVYTTRDGLRRLADAPPDVLLTHGFDSDAAAALREGDLDAMERCRAVVLDSFFGPFFRVRCGLDETDRPSISALVARADRLVQAA